MEYYLRDNCRLCESQNIIKLFSLEPTPPANAFVSEANISKKQTCYPLDLFLCNDCFHVQLNTVVDPEILFRDYVYVSGTSPSFISHFEDYAKSVIKRLNLQKSSLIIDIGSNDGTLLSKFNKFGMDILGVDPATEIAKQANDRGIETLNKYLETGKDRNIAMYVVVLILSLFVLWKLILALQSTLMLRKRSF